MDVSLAKTIDVAALAFNCALAGFTYAAQSRGWRYGAVFNKSWPTTMGTVLSAVLVFHAFQSQLPWWASILSWFVGGPVVYAVLGSLSGPASLVLAPVLTALAMCL